MNHLGLVSTKDMTSGRVADQLGEPMGSIKEFLVDPESGRIAMVVLGWGGVLGVGDTTRLVPWEAFTFLPNSLNFQLNIDRHLVDKSPEMTAEDAKDRQKVKALYLHYGYPAYWDKTVNYDTSDASFNTQGSDPHEPVNRDAAGNTHQQYEGSYQVSDPYFQSNADNQLKEELDYDKIKGNKPAGGS